MDEKLKKVEVLIAEAKSFLAVGDVDNAQLKLTEADDEIKRPIGSGTNGPENKD